MSRASGAQRWLPALGWLRTYDRADLPADLRAGATVAVLLIPQAMAYAALAGVPPITGLYAAVVSLLVYAGFGTSRYISVAPVAIDSLLTAAAIAPLADGDPDRYLALASALALLVGLGQVLAGVAGLGGLVNFLSVPVIAGFTSAAAVTIAMTQVKDLLGLSGVPTATTFVGALRALVPRLSTYSWAAALLAVAAILALIVLKRWAPRWPGPLLVVAGATAAVWALGLDVATVGAVPAGLPVPRLPAVGLDDLRALLPSAAAIALVSYLESVSTGTAFGRRTRTRVDPDQELVAVGLANAAAGAVHGFPVAGGFSRGAVNFNAGARTQLSAVWTAGLLVVALYTLTPVLAHLPKGALAAVIVVAVAGLVDLAGARSIGRVRHSDLVSLVATAVATLLLGPLAGLGTGLALSVALFFRHMARPHIPVLGQVPGRRLYRNVERYDVITRPDVVIVRIDAPLSFTSARPIAERLTEVIRDRPSAQYLVIDCSGVNTADYTGMEMLVNLRDELREAGVEVHLATLRGPVRDILERTQYLADESAAGRVHATVADAIDTIG